MEIIDVNKPKRPTTQFQSGLFWVGFYSHGDKAFDKAILSWPWHCESVAVPLPDDCKTQAEALKYLREQLVEALKEENGVNGP